MQSEQEKNVLKLKIERMQKDIEKAKERGNQGLTADQGSAQEITIGKLLKEVFEDKDDEITAYEKGEPGADWLQKVKNGGVEIGRILYESKKTKSFSKNWIDKLQQDMKETKYQKKIRVGLRWNNMNLLRVEDSELVGLVDPL